MTDRITFDLRIADHSATIARLDASDWRQAESKRHSLRATLAAWLVALAARLDPALRSASQVRGSATA